MMKEEGKTDIKVTRKDMEEFRKTHNDTITLSLQEWVYVQAALEYCSTIITNEFHDELKNIYKKIEESNSDAVIKGIMKAVFSK